MKKAFKYYLLFSLLFSATLLDRDTAGAERFKEIPAGIQFPFQAEEDESEGRYLPGVGFEKDIIEKTDIDLLVDRAPVLEPWRKKIQVKNGLLKQAALIPNPDFQWKTKKIPDDFQFGERTDEFYLSQRFEMGGKRHYRVKVKETEIEEAIEGFYHKRAVLKNEVIKLFNSICYLQKCIEKEKKVLSLVNKRKGLAKARLALGKISGKDFIDYDASYRRKGMRVEMLTGEIEEKLRLFEEELGLKPETIKGVKGKLVDVKDVPKGLDLSAELLDKNPEIHLLRRKVEIARQRLEGERHEYIPDITMRVMMATDRDIDEDTYGLEMLVPLPLFDRNQGKITAAKASLEQAQRQLHAKRSSLLGSLARLTASYKDTVKNLEKYNKEILPLAEETRRFFNLAYEAGRISMIENIGAEIQLQEAEIEAMKFQVRAQNLMQDIFFLAGRVH